jgi:hypothetical protein
MRRLQRTDLPDRLDAVDTRQHHVHEHRIERALHDALGRSLAAANEFSLVA